MLVSYPVLVVLPPLLPFWGGDIFPFPPSLVVVFRFTTLPYFLIQRTLRHFFLCTSIEFRKQIAFIWGWGGQEMFMTTTDTKE